MTLGRTICCFFPLFVDFFPLFLFQGPETEALTTSIGSIRSKPEQRSRGVLNVSFVVISFISLGSFLGQTGAGLLEEFEIFVPEDDDDD